MTLPTDFSGLVAWYRGDSVTVNGSALAAWLDQSGTGDPSKNATQSSSALRPTYNAADPNYNGQPTISFTAANQVLSTGQWNTPIAQPTTRIVVAHTLNAPFAYLMDSLNAAVSYAFLLANGTLGIGDPTIMTLLGPTASPSVMWAYDTGASSQLGINSTTAGTTNNAGTNGATGLTIGNYAGGGASFQGTVAEIIIYNRLLTAQELAKVLGYLQQRYGIPVLGSTQSATVSGTTLADLTLAAQQRCDRVNASSISSSEWTSMVNASAQELYGVLTSTDPDYNVKTVDFTLSGGSAANNVLAVGPGSSVADFFKPRAVMINVNSSGQYVPIARLESLQERHLYTYPAIVPIYGAIPSRWNLMGSSIEILPPTVAGNAYRMWYLPILPTLSLSTDSISQYWLTVNGWQEYIILDVAAKALIKEESLDTAQLMLQQKQALKQRIIMEAQPRDVSQPRAITDMARVRSAWAGWGGPGGMPGPGWGGDGAGGCW